MRVLWFTNTPSGYLSFNNNAYNGGGWIFSAEEEIKQRNEIELAVSFILDNQPEKVEQGGVCYYPLKSGKRKNVFSKIAALFQSNQQLSSKIEQLKKVVADFQPDIIQVFGSEQYFGLIAKYVQIPVVLHIQGILNPYLNAFFIPNTTKKNFIFQNFNPRKILSNIFALRFFKTGSKRESEIMQYVKYYIGRTEWDKRCATIMHPNCKYYYGSEILRKEFYEECNRKPSNSKPTIVTTISSPPYKGFDLVLKTAKLLTKNLNLNFEWRIFGNIDSNFAENQTGIKKENVSVKLCGVASASTLKKELLKASVYVHTSYIDNSPNSVCEAQILGLPVIVTHVGGTYSLIEEGVTGFSVPANDPYQMAYLIDKIIKDAILNKEIGNNARTMALKRHNKTQIIDSLIETYKSIIDDNSK